MASGLTRHSSCHTINVDTLDGFRYSRRLLLALVSSRLMKREALSIARERWWQSMGLSLGCHVTDSRFCGVGPEQSACSRTHDVCLIQPKPERASDRVIRRYLLAYGDTALYCRPHAFAPHCLSGQMPQHVLRLHLRRCMRPGPSLFATRDACKVMLATPLCGSLRSVCISNTAELVFRTPREASQASASDAYLVPGHLANLKRESLV